MERDGRGSRRTGGPRRGSGRRSWRRVGSAFAALAWLAACLGALSGCSPEPLTFSVLHVPVGYDANEVLDADLLDPDHDGDLDVLVATSADLRYLECDAGRRSDASSGTGLGQVAPVQRLHRAGLGAGGADGNGTSSGSGTAGAGRGEGRGSGSGTDAGDYLVERDGQLSRLVYSGIGSWREEAGPVPAQAPGAVLELNTDLDGDGLPDRARIVGRSVVIELQRAGGVFEDVSQRTGADGLLLPGDGRRLCAGDLEGDGDIDLLVVGGRLFALVNSGGR